MANGPVIFHPHTLIQPVSTHINLTTCLLFCVHIVFLTIRPQFAAGYFSVCYASVRAADVISAHEGLLILHVNLQRKCSL